MRFQSAFPAILVALLLGSTASASIPVPDVRAGLAARDAYQSGRPIATDNTVSPWWHPVGPAPAEPRRRYPAKKTVD
jgi:hypothetical protein